MGGGLHVALSGGGYRSTLFSIGSLFHLVRGGHLGRLVTLSSVSGGSYTNALAMAHPDFAGMDAPAYIEHFRAAVAATATRPVWSRLVRNRPDRHRDEPLVHTIMWENLIARTTVEWPVDSAITHVVEAANLHDADLIAFSNRGHRSQWLGHDPARTVPVRDAVSASSAIPLLFPPRRVSTRSFRRSVAVDVPPSVLSVDGGVLDSLAVSCLDLETIESGDPHTHLVVDATHSVTTRKWIPGTTLPIHRELLPGATWIASAFRATQVLPFLGKLRVLRQWTGVCDMSPDYSPIMGRTGVDGFLV
ncbi:MAG: patatin-like phospholipase family protein, partial [Acidimicrobiia bacterium]|nr:patatin-like phospholipase family protein [Acidimicrobiia bacterium]